VGFLLQEKNLSHTNIATKLVAFGSNGVNVFQGAKFWCDNKNSKNMHPIQLGGALCLSHNKLGYVNIIFFSFSAWNGNTIPILILVLLQKS